MGIEALEQRISNPSFEDCCVIPKGTLPDVILEQRNIINYTHYPPPHQNKDS